MLARASKKLIGEEGLLTELGPTRLDRDLQKYIWHDRPHLQLRGLREYLNRYIYLPRIKNQEVLRRSVQSAVSGMLPGPFAYAERWEESTDKYLGLAIDHASSAVIVIDGDSVIIKPEVAEAHRPVPSQPTEPGPGTPSVGDPAEQTPGQGPIPPVESNPTRFSGTVMISPDRPARDMHQIVEAIVEQFTTLQGRNVTLRL